jgi:tRNA (cytidine/uridine-2'-O-)-methyltransferase
MRIALYQPEIPHNTGTLMRLCACMGICLDIIHPCGFAWSDRHLRRAGMDYVDIATVHHHTNWQAFQDWISQANYRPILLDTKGEIPYTDFPFQANDILIAGQESSGVPDTVFHAVPHRLTIPMAANCRSLNLAIATAMVVGEALRQVKAPPLAQ